MKLVKRCSISGIDVAERAGKLARSVVAFIRFTLPVLNEISKYRLSTLQKSCMHTNCAYRLTQKYSAKKVRGRR
jgi:hypothetical protein